MENLFLLLDFLFTGANPDNLESFYGDFFQFSCLRRGRNGIVQYNKCIYYTGCLSKMHFILVKDFCSQYIQTMGPGEGGKCL